MRMTGAIEDASIEIIGFNDVLIDFSIDSEVDGKCINREIGANGLDQIPMDVRVRLKWATVFIFVEFLSIRS